MEAGRSSTDAEAGRGVEAAVVAKIVSLLHMKTWRQVGSATGSSRVRW